MSDENKKTLKNGPCGCCGEPEGVVGCCVTLWCPCYALYKTAENIGDDNGVVYCIGSLFGLGCCMWTVLGKKVAERAGVEMSIGKSAVCTLLNPCVCYDCAISNESELIKLANANGDGEPVAAAEVMEDRK